jgi:hypothetical protein
LQTELYSNGISAPANMVIPDIKCTNGVVHIIDSFITIKVLISSDDRDCFGYLNQQSQHFFATVFLRIEL